MVWYMEESSTGHSIGIHLNPLVVFRVFLDIYCKGHGQLESQALSCGSTDNLTAQRRLCVRRLHCGMLEV